MSRIGKHPVAIPAGVTAVVAGDEIVVKGKLGELKAHIPSGAAVKVEGDRIVVSPTAKTKQGVTAWGTARANINNMVKGVSVGFTKKLELIGVGYKAIVQGQNLKLTLGFSHDIDYKLPAGIKASAAEPTKLELSGFDKQLLGQVAAEIRSFRPPEPYKGKGVKYDTETILRKAGKKK